MVLNNSLQGSRKKKRRYRRRFVLTLSRLILQQLGELGGGLVESFFPKAYPEARMWRKLLNLDSQYQFKRATFSVLLSRLQSQGLVERPRGNHRFWRLSRRGKKYLSETENRGSDHAQPRDGIGRLVIFDIPETEREKRRAIREELLAAGFSPLQKSVWYGESPLPKDFVDLIDTRNLAACVHIFSIREWGTVPHKS